MVKHYLAEAVPDRPDPFHYEVASCQLFTALPADDRSSPVLIAHDPDARLLVLEDLGRSSTLADKLFGPDPETARRCLLGWARALGRIARPRPAREHAWVWCSGSTPRLERGGRWFDPRQTEHYLTIRRFGGSATLQESFSGRRVRLRRTPQQKKKFGGGEAAPEPPPNRK